MNGYGCGKYVYIKSEDYILSDNEEAIRHSNLSGNDNAPLEIGNMKHCSVLNRAFFVSNIIDYFSVGIECDGAKVRERR